MERVVLDSSTWVRGAISKTGAAGYIIQAWRDGRLDAVVSREILAETYEVLQRPHIQKKYHLSHVQKRRVIIVMAKYCLLVRPTETISVIMADPDDNAILAAALAGNVRFIITGDHHLLSLGQYRDIGIVTPDQYAHFLRKQFVQGR